MARDNVTVRLPNGRTVVMDSATAKREIAAGRAFPLTKPTTEPTTTATATPPANAMQPKSSGRQRA